MIKESFYRDINYLSYRIIVIYYLFFVSLIVISSSVYTYLLIEKFDIADLENNLIISNLQFDYGVLVGNLYDDWSYFNIRNNIKYYFEKLPAFPILITLLLKISKNIFFITITKSIILYSILFFSLLFTSKSLKKNSVFFFIILLLFIINPYNLHVTYSIFFADSLSSLLLPCFFILLFANDSRKYYFISVILFILYLTKTSMFFLVATIPIIILIIEKDSFKKKLIPFYGVIIAALIWGSFGIYKTNKFPIGSSLLSTNAEAMFHIAFNDKFKDYYPQRSVDLIPRKPGHSKNYNSEWEYYEYYNKKNSEYLKNNLPSFFKNVGLKLNFIFFNIKKDGVIPGENGVWENKFIASYLFSKIIFTLSFIISISIIIINLKKILILENIYKIRLDLYYIIILTLCLFPLLVGWATAKHLVGIQLVSYIYLFLKIYNNYKLKYRI